MAKFKVEMELQGLKIRMEGEREDIPLMARNLGDQVAGLMRPAVNIAEGENPVRRVPNEATQPVEVESKPLTRRKRKPSGGKAAGNGSPVPVDLPALSHDVERFGIPQQVWGGIDKAIWVLHIAREQMSLKDLSSIEMTAIYEKHFREAKAPSSSHFSTYLSRAKSRKPPPVASDNNGEVARWYLTQAGEEQAKGLIEQAIAATP